MGRSGQAWVGREERTLALLFRVGVAGCFIGHGMFGILGKEAWLPYFGVAGIDEEAAWLLMPVVGALDIGVGLLALLTPRPAVLLWAAGWATLTALLRPLAGESAFEALERAGNYGVPLAFLVLAGARALPAAAWWAPVRPQPLSGEARALGAVLRLTTAGLLLGHGALALQGKALLTGHVTALGLPPGALAVVGAVDVALALAVLARPATAVLVGALGWKLATEALYPLTGAPVWEFVERAGSYVAPLALLVMVRRPGRATLPASTAVRAGGRRVTPAALSVALLVTPGVGEARPQEAELLERLRQGGHVLACRHAITDRTRGDARRVDFSDPSTQRVLSAEGEAQARRLGEVLGRLGIPVGEVRASPYARTAVSAELTFGRVQVDDALFGGGPRKREALRALFTSAPASGTNRALVTHQGILYGMMPDLPRGSVREGDCVVVRPDGRGDFTVVTRLGPGDWGDLGEAGGTETGTAAAIAAARAGGTTLVCRHARTGPTREVEPVDYGDPSTQRLLSAEGEEQSRALGRALEALGVEIAELLASPMQRARRTAALLAGREPRVEGIWHTNGGSYGGAPRQARLQFLAREVPRGNRLVVSHIGTMASVLPEAEGRVGEGDCVVVRPAGGAHEIVGVVPWRTWLDAAGLRPAGRRAGPVGGAPEAAGPRGEPPGVPVAP